MKTNCKDLFLPPPPPQKIDFFTFFYVFFRAEKKKFSQIRGHLLSDRLIECYLFKFTLPVKKYFPTYLIKMVDQERGETTNVYFNHWITEHVCVCGTIWEQQIKLYVSTSLLRKQGMQ